MKDLNKVQEFFSKPLNEGRIDQSQVFDQSEVDRIMGEVREITGILEDTYNKDVQYKEFRFGDGTGGFQFQWDHGGGKWGGRFGLSLKEDGAHKLSALSYYDNSSFGSEDIKPNNPIILDVETWKDLDTSMLTEIWSQLKPMVIKNEAGARKALNREAKAQADYYRGKADTGRIGYGLSSQPRMRNESVNEAEFKHISGGENKIKLAIKDVEKQARLKANRDKPLEYAQLSLNKIMLSKVLGREELGKEHQGAWEKLKKEYNLNESVNEGLPPGYAKFLVSLQTLIGDIAPNAWEDKSQIDSTLMKRVHNSLKKRYGDDYAKFNDLLKTQKGQFGNWYLKESVNEMDMNDPIMVKMRAAKDKKPDFGKAYGDAVKTAYGNDKNAKKLAFLKKERAQLMRDMEQEAEPEGGSIADEYGAKLNRIDKAIAKLSGRKEMTYDQAIAEGLSPKDFPVNFTYGDTTYVFDRIAKDRAVYYNPRMGGDTAVFGSREEMDSFLDDYTSPRGGTQSSQFEAIAEAKVDYDFSERELIRVLRQLKRGASTEIDMIKAFTKALGRDITKDELFSESIDEGNDKIKDLEQQLDFHTQMDNKGRASIIKDKIEKLRKLSNSGEIDGDEFLDKFNPLSKELKSIDEATSQYPNFEVDRNIKYQDTVISKGYWVYTDTEQGGKGVYRNLMNDQILGFSSDDFDMFRKHLSSHFDIIESLDENILETIKLGEGIIEEELCAKGKAYRKKRMAAGEKSSAYLSGRAVKVCKGQMSSKKNKK